MSDATSVNTLFCTVEALYKFRRVLSKEALAVHDAHIGMAAAIQHIWRIAHE